MEQLEQQLGEKIGAVEKQVMHGDNCLLQIIANLNAFVNKMIAHT
jgi:hypothetical protein